MLRSRQQHSRARVLRVAIYISPLATAHHCTAFTIYRPPRLSLPPTPITNFTMSAAPSVYAEYSRYVLPGETLSRIANVKNAPAVRALFEYSELPHIKNGKQKYAANAALKAVKNTPEYIGTLADAMALKGVGKTYGQKIVKANEGEIDKSHKQKNTKTTHKTTHTLTLSAQSTTARRPRVPPPLLALLPTLLRRTPAPPPPGVESPSPRGRRRTSTSPTSTRPWPSPSRCRRISASGWRSMRGA